MPSQYVTLGRAQYGCTFDNKLYLIFNSKFIISSQGLSIELQKYCRLQIIPYLCEKGYCFCVSRFCKRHLPNTL